MTAMTLALTVLWGCTPVPANGTSTQKQSNAPPAKSTGESKSPASKGENEAPVMNYSLKVLTPTADGTEQYSTDFSFLDASHTSEGYVMASYTGDNPRVKFIITAPNGAAYQYDLVPGAGFVAFPLTEGSGTYQFITYLNVDGASYMPDLTQTLEVSIANEYSPFLYPSQYVNFNGESAVVTKALELSAGAKDDFELVSQIHSFAVENITYDHEKAKRVATEGMGQNVPNPDHTLEIKNGICLDYAATVTAMLRSLGIPTQMQFGYLQTQFHAWISVHLEGKGWVNGLLEFNGQQWTMMDPTTAAAEGMERTVTYLTTPGYYTTQYKY